MPRVTVNGLPDTIEFSATDWPQGCPAPHPGDLTQFMPQGHGFVPPPVVTPWGVPLPPSDYSFQPPSAHPFHAAPRTADSGGTLYFGTNVAQQQLTAALTLMGVREYNAYVAYAAQSADPAQDRYLEQIRLLSHFALSWFKCPQQDAPHPQTLNISEAVWAFMEAQRRKWDNQALDAVAGASGDNYPRLAFGFHVENSYYGVYRVWSRVSIVTK